MELNGNRIGDNGNILSQADWEKLCRRRGLCVRCGNRTHEVKPWGRKALTNREVDNGTCLRCYPPASSSKRPNTSVAAAARVVVAVTSPSSPRTPASPPPTMRAVISDMNIRQHDESERDRRRAHKRPGLQKNGHRRVNSSDAVDDAYSSGESSKSLVSLEGLKSNGDGASRPPWLKPDMDDASLARSTGDDAVKVMKYMRDYPEDRVLLRHACHQLLNIGNNTFGSMYEIFDVMNRNDRDGKLLAAACGAVWGVTRLDDDKKVEASEGGGVTVIVTALTKIPGDPNLVQWGLGALSCLCNVMENREMVNEAGGITVALAALKNHSQSFNVLEWASRLLFNLVHFEESGVGEEDGYIKEAAVVKKNIATIKKAGGVTLLLKVMKNCADAGVALEWSFKVLWLLAENGANDVDWSNNDVVSDLKDPDGLLLCAKAVRAKPSSQGLQEMALVMLSILMEVGHGDVALYTNVGHYLSSITTAMNDHPASTVIQEAGCKVLAVLTCTNRHFRNQMKDAGAIDVVVSAMFKHMSVAAVQRSGCWTIWAMSSPISLLDDSLNITEILDVLCKSLDAHTSDILLQRAACGSIANLALRSDVNVAKIPIDGILATMALHNGAGASVLEQGCRALSNICVEHSSVADAVVNANGIEQVVKAMACSPAVESLQLEGMNALCSVLSHSNNKHREAIVVERGIDAIAEAMREHETVVIIQAKGCYALALLAMSSKSKQPIIQCKAMDVVMHSMKLHASSRDMQVRACLALRNMALVMRMPQPEDTIKAILESLRNFGSDAILQKEACGALCALIMHRKEASSLPLHDLLLELLRIVDENKGDDRRPFNGPVLADALSGLECISQLALGTAPGAAQIQQDDFDKLMILMYAILDQESEPMRIELLVKSLSNLYFICKDKANEDTIIRCGGIVGVVDVMQENEGISDIEEVGCAILAEVSTENMEVKLCIAETDGIESIISAMMHNPQNSTIQTQACAVLSHLSVDKESRNLITHQGGIMLIIGAMQTLREDSACQEHTCSALCNLVADVSQDVLLEWQVIEHVVETMQFHVDVPKVQERALGILQNLSMRSNPLKVSMTNARCIEVILNVVNENLFSSVVVERALTTLWSLAVIGSNQRRISRANGLNTIINGMMANISASKVQKQGCGCICTLSSSDFGNKKAFRNNGGLDAVVFSMWSHLGSQSLQVEGLRALASLAAKSNGDAGPPPNESVVGAIILAMEQFPDAVKLQELACLAFRNLSLYPSCLALMKPKSNEIETLLNKASIRFPRECSERANQVLSNIT